MIDQIPYSKVKKTAVPAKQVITKTIKPINRSAGKGDSPRPKDSKNYNHNYESIEWN